MIYAMSDIHGDYANFRRILKKVRFCDADTMYILGDVFDKGDENLRLYYWICGHSNAFWIKGNHEYLCERYLNGTIDAQLWDACGGINTRMEVDRLDKEEKEKLLGCLKALPVYLTVKVNESEYFLTHSGYDADCCVMSPEKTSVDIAASVEKAVAMNQEKYLFSNDIHYIPANLFFDKEIVVGHYPTLLLPEYQKAEIYKGRKYINIDTGNDCRSRGGRLACVRLDDGEAFYV